LDLRLLLSFSFLCLRCFFLSLESLREDEEEDDESDDEDFVLKKSDDNERQTGLDDDLQNPDLIDRKMGDWKKILKQKDVWISALCYGLLAFSTIGFDEIFSVWIITSVRLGGLSFTSEQTATIYLIAGVAVIAAQLVAPIIIDKLGPLLTFRIGTFYFGLFSSLFPFLNLFTSSGKTLLMVGACIIFLFRNACSILSFTSLFLLVNHSTDPDLIGTANGIAQSTASLMRGLGPLSGGFMLSWSLSNGLDFPFDHYFTFFIFALGLCVTSFVSFFLPKSIDSRKK